MMIGPRPEAVAEAEGRIKTADALVDFSRAHLKYHTIRAPIDGVLDSLHCHPGQTIAIGSPIGEVVDSRQVFASVWLPPGSAQSVRVGQAARVQLSDTRVPVADSSAAPEGHGDMTGKVAYVGRVADPQTGNLPIRVLVDNPQGRLTIGQSLRVSIVVDERKAVLQVPAAAVLDLGEGPVLSVVRDGKTVVLHPEPAISHQGWIEVAGTDLKAGEPVIVEGGYNLPEKTAVKVSDEKEEGKEKEEAEHKEDQGERRPSTRRSQVRREIQARREGRAQGGAQAMSVTVEPAAEPHSLAGSRVSINLIAKARPYFGLIVLTTTLLTAYGIVSMLRMPSGIYPEVAFPRIVVIAQTPGLAVKDVEVAVTRPIEEAVSIVLGVVRVRSKSVRGAAQLDIDFAPGTDMIQALNDIRARMAEVGAQLPPGTTSIIERQTPSVFPIISFVVTGGRDPSALHDYAYYDLRPRISRIPDVSYVTVQGGDIREILVEVEPQALAAANLSIADVADRLDKEHRLKAVGRIDRGTLQYQVLSDTLATNPLDLEERGHRREERPGDPLARPRPGDDRARRPDDGDPVQRQGRRRLDGLPPPGRQRAGRLARPGRRAGRRRQECPARRRDPSRLRSGRCWSARRSPTSATPSSSAAC